MGNNKVDDILLIDDVLQNGVASIGVGSLRSIGEGNIVFPGIFEDKNSSYCAATLDRKAQSVPHVNSKPVLQPPFSLLSYPLLDYIKQFPIDGSSRNSWLDLYLLGFGIDPRLLGCYIHFPYLQDECFHSIGSNKGIIVVSKKCLTCPFYKSDYCNFHNMSLFDWKEIISYFTPLSDIDRKVSLGYGPQSPINTVYKSYSKVQSLYNIYGEYVINILLPVLSSIFPVFVGILQHIRKIDM